MRTRLIVFSWLSSGLVLAQSAGTFNPAGEMTTARMYHSATLLANGKVLIAGGWRNVPEGQNCTGTLHVRAYFLNCVQLLSSAELYDPATGTFTPTGDMTGVGLFHKATLLPDGRVLINHGVATRGANVEIYDPKTATFSAIDSLPSGALLDALLSDGNILFLSDPAKLYNPVEGTLVPTAQYAGKDGSLSQAIQLATGKLLLLGSPGCCSSSGRTELYDPATATFRLTAPIFVTSETTFLGTLLPDGRVLVTGGDFSGGDDSLPLGSGVYDPASETFTATANLTRMRLDFTATLLTDGSVFIAGGDLDPPSTGELYDPVTGTFATTGPLLTSRFAHTATLLPDGRVLILGGLPFSTTTTASAELYTPQTVRAAPALLSLSGEDRGQGAILHARTAQVASAANPASAGEALEIYLTGLADGNVIPPQVSIGGRAAEVLWFGKAPGYAGLYQINIRVPAAVAPGAAIPVRLNYIGRPSNEVTIGLK